MKIERKRYIVMRNNRTEIWCGLAQHYHFVKIDEIKDAPIKTYLSEQKAKSSCSSWDKDYEIVPVIEVIETEN